MCHPHHLCFTLSVILCIGAAYGQWDDYDLDRDVKKELEKLLLKGKKAEYDPDVEERLADDISSYTMHHTLKKPEDITKLLWFVNKIEVVFFSEGKYFKSKQQLFEYFIHVEGKVGCAQLPHNPYGYICLIEKPAWLWQKNF